MYNSIYEKIVHIMKAQDRFPYDSTILGLDNLYYTVGNDSFYIKSNCIASTGNLITIGKEYIIFDRPTESGIKMSEVILLDCYYYEGIIHLIVQDVRSKRVFTISQCLECPENDCTWLLVDLNYFIDRMDDRAINDYCQCGTNKKQPIGNGKIKADDDLLEFEF
jgi:hypothetical protein